MSKKNLNVEDLFEISAVAMKESAEELEAQVYGIEENSVIMDAYSNLLYEISNMMDKHAKVEASDGVVKVPARLKSLSLRVRSLSKLVGSASRETAKEEKRARF